MVPQVEKGCDVGLLYQRGSFLITGLEHVDPFGVAGASVRISDADGQPVIVARAVANIR